MTLLIPVTRLPEVHPLIEANPDLTVVIDHMADSPLDHPEQLDLLLALQRYPRVFVKISHAWSLSSQSHPYPDAIAQIKRLYATFGAARLMAGTDWPVSLPQAQLRTGGRLLPRPPRLPPARRPRADHLPHRPAAALLSVSTHLWL